MVLGCCCSSLDELSVVPMGDGDDLDQRVFATLERVRLYGDDLWWLYESRCTTCGQAWLVAQDERIYDNFYLRRLSDAEAKKLEQHNCWPNDFSTYEQVLRLGRTLSDPWIFLDPQSPSLAWTAADLRKERPDISVAEIAYLLAIEPSAAAKLLPA